jgi:hypothetical protein
MATPKKTVYRDSGTGEFIKKSTAERKDPRTWEKEHVPTKKQ